MWINYGIKYLIFEFWKKKNTNSSIKAESSPNSFHTALLKMYIYITKLVLTISSWSLFVVWNKKSMKCKNKRHKTFEITSREQSSQNWKQSAFPKFIALLHSLSSLLSSLSSSVKWFKFRSRGGSPSSESTSDPSLQLGSFPSITVIQQKNNI